MAPKRATLVEETHDGQTRGTINIVRREDVSTGEGQVGAQDGQAFPHIGSADASSYGSWRCRRRTRSMISGASLS